MTSINSFSVTDRDYSLPQNIVRYEQTVRVFDRKGLFIIPYEQGPVIVSVDVWVKVVATTNETLSMWTNPELGFYGYAHPRVNKMDNGSPVQVNQRAQWVYRWFAESVLIVLQLRAVKRSLLASLLPQQGPETVTHIVGPLVSDLSFGFSRTGRYQVTARIGYLTTDYIQSLDLGPISQDRPNPSAVNAIDPTGYRQLGDPETPTSDPYQGDSFPDYGESEPGTEVPEEPPDEDGFSRVRVNSEIYNPQNGTVSPLEFLSEPYRNPVTVVGLPWAIAHVGCFVNIRSAGTLTEWRWVISGDEQWVLDNCAQVATFSVVPE